MDWHTCMLKCMVHMRNEAHRGLLRAVRRAAMI